MLEALREDVITDEQFKRLESFISSDQYACELYVWYMQFCSDLHYFQYANTPAKGSYTQSLSEAEFGSEVLGSDVLDNTIWQALAEDEKTAPGIVIEKTIEKSLEPRLGLMKVEKPKRTISRLSVYTLILSAAAMLLLMILVLSSPVRPIVATLTDSINAEWISEEDTPTDGDFLRQGELTLAKGFAEITFHDGAVVIVEAPAIIELESPKSMFVTSGRISAIVSEYATGFIVNTHSASIVDLGTEFGVSVGGDGSCSLHMFKGKANLIAGRKDQKRSSQIINANEAKSIDPMSGAVRAIRLSEKCFVRRIDSEKGIVWRGESLNMADVVGGGNGFGTGKFESGIDLDTGLFARHMNYLSQRPGHDKYLSVRSNKMIDGVFIPDGGDGAVQIDSDGNIFAGCPDTSGAYWTQIANSGRVGVDGRVNHQALLGGMEYGTKENPSIIMVPNVGITFDLNNIREDLPGIMIAQFKAKCGVSESLIGVFGEGAASNIKSDFWVFVDGEKRFEVIALNSIAGPQDIKVDIKSEDRFLTLIVTDGDMSIAHDWSIFGNPTLVLESGQ